MIRSTLLLSFILAGCSSPTAAAPTSGGSAAASDDPPPCEESNEPMCTRTACGANSDRVNTFPTDGARNSGQCNRDGVQLMPRMGGGVGGKCQGAKLYIRDNKLIGIEPSDGSTKCHDTDLKGATFVLRSAVKDGGAYRTLTVKVADINPAYRADPYQRPRMAYRLVGEDGSSLCTPKGSTAARKRLGLKEVEGLTEPAAGRDLAIAVQSELYNMDGHAVKVNPKWKVREPEWMQFACVDDALAKRSLYNLDSDDVAASRSALLMFIANYCGDVHATTRGAEIRWEMFDDALTKGTTPGLLEAKWGPDGAVCMSNPRALHRTGDTAQLPAKPIGDVETISKACNDCTVDKWADLVRKCDAIHSAKPIPTCEACTSDACKGPLLHSYVNPAKAR